MSPFGSRFQEKTNMENAESIKKQKMYIMLTTLSRLYSFLCLFRYSANSNNAGAIRATIERTRDNRRQRQKERFAAQVRKEGLRGSKQVASLDATTAGGAGAARVGLLLDLIGARCFVGRTVV